MNNENPDIQTINSVLYTKRFLYLFILWLLNFVNGIIWISLSSIEVETAQYLKVTEDQFSWLSAVFPLFIIIGGLPVIYVIGKIGLRSTLIVCGWLNLASAVLRYLSLWNRDIGFYGLLAAQCLAAVAQPLSLFTPAKLSSTWFPPNHRAIATTIAAMGNPLGIMIGMIVPPCMEVNRIVLLNQRIFEIAITIPCALLPTLFIRRSTPINPPSASCERSDIGYGYWQELKQCLLNISFIILAICFGCGVGIFSSLSSLMNVILCPYGYESNFVSICGGLLLGVGLIGSFFIGLIADKTRAFKTIIQLSLIIATFGLIGFGMCLQLPHNPYMNLLAVSIGLFGAFSVGIYSICLELAAEITYPVSENASTGLLTVVGQIFTLVFIVGLPPAILSIPNINSSNDTYNCTTKKNGSSNQTTSTDGYWAFVLFLAGLSCISSVLVFFIKACYRRQEFETANFGRQSSMIRSNDISTMISNTTNSQQIPKTKITDVSDSGFYNRTKQDSMNYHDDLSSLLDASYTS